MRRALIAVCSLAMLGGSSTVAAAAQPQAHPDGGGQPRMVGYFIQWGIYGRPFYVKNLVDNGSAEKLTVINYAFGNVAPNGERHIVCKSFDTWADYGRPTERRTASTASATSGANRCAGTSTSCGS